jgi:hypothetical protein
MTKPTALDWLRAHTGHEGEDCLIWPFSRSRGHAQVSIKGKVKKAARIMCALVNGPPPTPKHETAHSCGCGHLGCVHPKHVSWKTRSDNQRDRWQHGTQAVGGAFKLNPEKVAEIRAIGNSVSKEELGRRYNVTPANIAKVLKGKTWPSGDYTPRGFAVRRSRRNTIGGCR